MMYEKYMICKDSLRNVKAGDEVTGFELKVRIPYYRGVPLSFVEDFIVEINGEKYTGKDMTFTVSGGTFTFDEMPTVTSFRWEFGEEATLFIKKPGGIAPGTHKLTVECMVRVSYMMGFRSYVKGWADVELAG